MSTIPSEQKVKNFKRFTIIASIAIPVVVAVLFGVKIPGVDLSFLPGIYATINGITAVLLVGALIAIKMKNIALHERLIKTCLVLSLLFLASYVAYHMTSDSTKYGGDFKTIYFFILISHILLSIAVVPLVLFTYLFAWQGNFEKHKKWTKITWPLWFYVAVTGVIVYWMISPFYIH
jgi:putative membrane protein